MTNILKLAAAVVVVLGGGVLALVLLGIWPGPSPADREQSRVQFGEAEAAMQSGDQDRAQPRRAQLRAGAFAMHANAAERR